MTQEEVIRLKETCEVGFTTYAGIRFTCIEEGHTEGEIVIEEHHLNQYDTIHGGLLSVLTDTIGGLATMTKNGFIPATASSSISYLKPTLGVKKLVAKADVIKFGHTLSVVQTDVFDENGVLLVTSLSNYSNITDKVNL